MSTFCVTLPTTVEPMLSVVLAATMIHAEKDGHAMLTFRESSMVLPILESAHKMFALTTPNVKVSLYIVSLDSAKRKIALLMTNATNRTTAQAPFNAVLATKEVVSKVFSATTQMSAKSLNVINTMIVTLMSLTVTLVAGTMELATYALPDNAKPQLNAQRLDTAPLQESVVSVMISKSSVLLKTEMILKKSEPLLASLTDTVSKTNAQLKTIQTAPLLNIVH